MKPKRNVYQFSNFILKNIKYITLGLWLFAKFDFEAILSIKNILKFVNFNTKTALKSVFRFAFLVSKGIFATRSLNF